MTFAKIHITILFFLCSLFFSLSAQVAINTTTYKGEDGLQPVASAYTDFQGYTWCRPAYVGAPYMLRFDGKDFITFEDIGSYWTRIWVGNVRHFLRDHQKHVWIGTDKGLHHFSYGEVWQHFNKGNGLTNDTIVSLRSSTKGVFILSPDRISFLSYHNYYQDPIRCLDSTNIKIFLGADLEVDKERQQIIFNVDHEGSLWYSIRKESDSTNLKLLKFDANDNYKMTSYTLDLAYSRVDQSSMGLILKASGKFHYLSSNGEIIAFDERVKNYVGQEDSINYFVTAEGLCRMKETRIDDFYELDKEDYDVIRGSKGRNFFGVEKFNGHVWTDDYETELYYQIVDDSLISVEKLYGLKYDLNENNFKFPGDGALWDIKWGKLGIQRNVITEEVKAFHHPKTTNGMGIMEYNKWGRWIVVADEDNRIYHVNMKTGIYTELKYSKSGPDDRNHYLDWVGGSYVTLRDADENVVDLFEVDGKRKRIIPRRDILELAKNTSSFFYSILEEKWRIALSDSSILCIDEKTGEESLFSVPNNGKIKDMFAFECNGAVYNTDNEVFALHDGDLINITETYGLAPNHMTYTGHDEKYLTMSGGGVNLWYANGQVYTLDTATYPELKSANRLFADNLNRIITYAESDTSKGSGAVWVIDNGDYLKIPHRIREEDWAPVMDYFLDSTLMFVDYNVIYRYDGRSNSFYPVFNSGDYLGYWWSSKAVAGNLIFSGWGNYVLNLDLYGMNPIYPECVFRNIRVDDKITPVGSMTIGQSQRLSVEVFSHDEGSYNHMEYQYRFKDEDDGWSKPIKNNRFDFNHLSYGRHFIEFRARGVHKRWGDPIVLDLYVSPPWYASTLAIWGYGLAIFVLYWLTITFNSRRLRRYNAKLKRLVDTRTQEVRDKNEEILASINYAKRIQDAILPSASMVNNYLKNTFVLYLPKDIVAGDFYWFDVVDDDVYFAAADCTGHGVPGAMVSVVCANALKRAVNEMGLKEPAVILDKVRQLVVENFESSEHEVKDGMDIAFCRLNPKTGELAYAGAHNPLYVVKPLNGQEDENIKYKTDTHQLIEYKGDKQPIGKFAFEKPFTQTDIQLSEGDTIYLTSDGYPDQFGGEKGRKFMYKPFKNLLLSLQDKSLKDQRTELKESFAKWKGGLDQVDDVCVIGVKI